MKFLQKYQYQLRPPAEQQRLERNANALEADIRKQIRKQRDWDHRCRLAKSLRKNALNKLHDLLVIYEKKAIANKAIVYWASDDKEALERILMLVKRAEAQSLHLDYAPILTEVGLEKALANEQFIVQPSLPSHLVLQQAKERATHAQHLLLDKSRKGVIDFVNKKFNFEIDAMGKEANQETLDVLRSKVNKYPVFPSVSIFNPDFMFSESGSLFWMDNEGSSSWNLSCTSINIAIVGIEQIMHKFDERFRECLSVFNLYRHGQMEPNFLNMLYGPAHKDEKDGPSQLYVIILDNGRSDLLANPNLRDALIDLEGWSQWFARTWSRKVKKSNFPQHQVNRFRQFDSGDIYFQTLASLPDFNPFDLDYESFLYEMRHLSFTKNSSKSEKALMEQWETLIKNRLEITKLRGGLKKRLFQRKLKQTLPEAEHLPNIAPQTFTEWWASRK